MIWECRTDEKMTFRIFLMKDKNKKGSLFPLSHDAMYRSGRELPRDERLTNFPHPRQREKWKSDIMQHLNASPFEGSDREELEKGRQVKRTGDHSIKNKVDSIDDKIRLSSRLIEAPTTVGPPSKILRFPAWRPIHWIRPFDRINFCLFYVFLSCKCGK